MLVKSAAEPVAAKVIYEVWLARGGCPIDFLRT